MTNERRGVLVEGGVVRNIILWSDDSEAQYEAEGWDYAIETTQMANQPGAGWLYDETYGFRTPQPFPSWVWSNERNDWESPVSMPEEGDYAWDEPTQSWLPLEG